MPAKAASTRQWAYLNWRFGHQWTRQHQIFPPNRTALPTLGTEGTRGRRAAIKRLKGVA